MICPPYAPYCAAAVSPNATGEGSYPAQERAVCTRLRWGRVPVNLVAHALAAVIPAVPRRPA